MLATLSDLKLFLDIDTDHADGLLARILAGVSARSAAYCGRRLEYRAGLTEFHDGGRRALFLAAYPIVSVAEVRESPTRDFASAAVLVEGEDFLTLADAGGLVRLGGPWPAGRRTVRVIYAAGYVDPADEPGSDEEAVPPDLQRAVLLQARYEYQRRDRPAAARTAVAGTTAEFDGPLGLLPEVRTVLDGYRRFAV